MKDRRTAHQIQQDKQMGRMADERIDDEIGFRERQNASLRMRCHWLMAMWIIVMSVGMYQSQNIPLAFLGFIGLIVALTMSADTDIEREPKVGPF